MIRVLFVCLGNICRSPAAEGVFIDLVKKKSLMGKFDIDSAGTSGHHQGERADARMLEHVKRRGIDLPSLSRKLLTSDFRKFDYIIVMDDSNYENSLLLTDQPEEQNKLLKMADFTPSFSEREVPDPYYGGAAGFEKVLDMVEEGSMNLLKKIIEDHPELDS